MFVDHYTAKLARFTADGWEAKWRLWMQDSITRRRSTPAPQRQRSASTMTSIGDRQAELRLQLESAQAFETAQNQLRFRSGESFSYFSSDAPALDPTVERVVGLVGGWERIAATKSNPRDLGFLVREFNTFYIGLRRQQPAGVGAS